MYGTITRYGSPFQADSISLFILYAGPITPIYVSILVWALPLSLATTYGIIVIFSSCRYLDVSVPHVHAFAIDLQSIGFPHSDIYGSKLVCSSP